MSDAIETVEEIAAETPSAEIVTETPPEAVSIPPTVETKFRYPSERDPSERNPAPVSEDAKAFAERVANKINEEIAAESPPDSDITAVLADLLGSLNARSVEEAVILLDEIKASVIAGRWPDVATALEILFPAVEG